MKKDTKTIAVAGDSWAIIGGDTTRRACLTLLVFFLGWRMSTTTADNDTWHCLNFGRELLSGRGFPYQDFYSYMPTLPRIIYHEWLNGIVIYSLYNAFGGTALQLFKFFMGYAMWFFLWKTSRRAGASGPWTAVLLGLAAIPMTISFSPVRAQIFGNLCFAIYLYLLFDASRRKTYKLLAVIPFISILWANWHGGFAAGLGIIFLFAVGEYFARRPVKPILIALVASTLATLLNPFGIDYWIYMPGAVGMPRPNIVEWGSILTWAGSEFSDPSMGSFAFLIAVVAFAAWYKSGHRSPTQVLLLVVTALLALRHIRHLPFFISVAAVSAAVDLTLITRRIPIHVKPRDSVIRFFRTGILVAVVIVAFRLAFASPLTFSFSPDDKGHGGFPDQALQFASERGYSGNIAVWFDWGSFVAFQSDGLFKVSYDGRYEVGYPDETTKANFDFYEGRTADILLFYPTEFVLLPPDCPGAQTMSLVPGWREVYRDKISVLWMRVKT